MTKEKYMIEGFWNGKAWINVYNYYSIECDWWRKLPKFNPICLKNTKKSINKDRSTGSIDTFKRLRRVIYDHNGKMHITK